MTWNLSLIDGPIPIFDVTGYHLNIAPQVYTAELEQYAVTPTVPRRVFAGAETVFLRFADEAEARSVLGAYWIEPEQ
jgi:hypothetical protein